MLSRTRSLGTLPQTKSELGLVIFCTLTEQTDLQHQERSEPLAKFILGLPDKPVFTADLNVGAKQCKIVKGPGYPPDRNNVEM